MSDLEDEINDRNDNSTKEIDDNNDYVIFGTPIELKEDELEFGKKIMRTEDQTVTDEKGRRRFHGAFTGGFSAGYFNTCGSEQGWVPQTFSSSRKNRISSLNRKPEDFMDNEDLGEFGIAPRKYSAKQEYTSSNSKIKEEIDESMDKHQTLRSLIPDEELYSSLNIVAKITIGYQLMKKMGWKEGRGIGELISVSQNKKDKVYGCDLPPHLQKPQASQQLVWIPPKDTIMKIPEPKINLMGIGYESLRVEASILNKPIQVNQAFKPTGNEKKGIKGTAYGIGVYDEHEDEDEIYDNDDIANYDFSLEDANSNKKDPTQDTNINSKVWHGFIKPKSKLEIKGKQYNIPVIPDTYQPKAILGKDVSHTYIAGNRVTYDNSARSALIGEKKEINQAIKTECPIIIPTDNLDNKDVIHDQTTSSIRSSELNMKFVSGGHSSTNPETLIYNDRLAAAHAGMFGKLTRTIETWHPSQILCRRFNIVCVGSKNDKISFTEPKKYDSTQILKDVKPKPSPVQTTQKLPGPLSILNLNQPINLQEPPKKTKWDVDKEILPVKPIVVESKMIEKSSSYDNFEKPDIDFFKTVFDSDSDDESPLVTTRNQASNQPNNHNQMNNLKRKHEEIAPKTKSMVV